MSVERAGFSADQVASGKVVIAGGDQHSGATPTAIETWHPDTGLFSVAGDLIVARGGIAAAKLPDGSLLYVGGFGPSNAAWPSAEVIDPEHDLFAAATDGAPFDTELLPSRPLVPFASTLAAGASTPDVRVDATSSPQTQ
jgi:hypothetical protein